MLREQIRNIETGGKTLRNFGLLLTVFLSALGGISWWKSGQAYVFFFPAAIVSVVAAIVRPQLLRPIYVPWMTVATIIGWFMTRVILSTLYFLVFTPASLVMKLLGKDPLDQRIEPTRQTYWVEREQRRIQPEDFEHQF